jgi:hypothetical protein
MSRQVLRPPFSPPSRSDPYSEGEYLETPYSFAYETQSLSRTLLQAARKASYALNADLTVRLFGGWSLMVLTR